MSKSHIIGVFDDEFSLVKAVEEIREKDIRIEEVYTPYPVHEVINAMGKKDFDQFAANYQPIFTDCSEPLQYWRFYIGPL